MPDLLCWLYLLFRPDPINPTIGYLGSSNLTFAGLSRQGELNIDVLDHDACNKLARWFEDRWNDRWCIDISDDLIKVVEQSWAREELIPPYHIYVKIAYHLSREAREGINPQTKAKIQIAATTVPKFSAGTALKNSVR